MSEQPQDPSSAESSSSPPFEGQPVAAATAADGGPASATAAEPGPAARAQSLSQRPEVLIGATFAGGFVLAAILKRLAR